jgi:hypothetical protein
MFVDKTDCKHFHIHICNCESFITSIMADCRHYTNISHLLYLINAVVVGRTIQEDTYRFTMLSAHTYCRLNTNELLVFNFLSV